MPVAEKKKSGAGFQALLPLILCVCLLPWPAGGRAASLETGQPASCVESGYRVIESQGAIQMEVILPAGHRFTPWEEDAANGRKTRICQVCGYQESVRPSAIAEDSLPRLDLLGDMEGIGKKSRVALEASFEGLNQRFSCYGLLTLQGHSTFGYPKKNYTIRFYDDPAGETKHKVQFRSWHREHKYILKANYVDASLCRNLVAAGLWKDMVDTRSNVPARVRALPTRGAVDGIPTAVYLNGDFFGLYTMNLHKDDDLYQMEEGKKEALLICNRQTADEALFRAPAAFAEDYSSDWEVEFCGTEDETWAKQSFNELISFLMNSSDEAFRARIGDLLDVDAAVDYLLFLYALGLRNGGAKDLVMLSYGGCWIPSAYDMDEAFGLDAQEFAFCPPEEFLPSCRDGLWDSGTGSLLWDRVLNCFPERVMARYQALRETLLSADALIGRVQDFMAQIPVSFYDYDDLLFPERPLKNEPMAEQIRQYIVNRLPLLDNALKGGMEQ